MNAADFRNYPSFGRDVIECITPRTEAFLRLTAETMRRARLKMNRPVFPVAGDSWDLAKAAIPDP